MAVPKYCKHRFSVSSSNLTSRHKPKRIESKDLNTYFYICVHSSTIHNSQKVEPTQMSMDECMDKRNVVCTYTGILFRLKKKWNSDKLNATKWRKLEDIR